MAHILVIDDDKAVAKSLEFMLKSIGHTVEIRFDGSEGMKAVKSSTFDLVISDIIMPEEDGFGVLHKVKKYDPSMKVILISGGGRISSADYLSQGKLLGANGVLRKPFSLTELKLKLVEILG